MKITKVKVIKSSNPLLWYARHIGEVFEVTRTEKDSFWVLEPSDQFRLINWIKAEDVEIVQD